MGNFARARERWDSRRMRSPWGDRQDVRQRSFSTGCGARPPKTRDEIVKAPLEWSLAGGVKRANAKAGNQR